MAEPARSRRSALQALILSLLGGAGLLRFLTPRGRRPSRGALEVPVADVPSDGALVLPRHRCAVVRRRGVAVALDLACPHLGCTVSAHASGFACPCHGSRFDAAGAVLEGPAARSLERLGLEQRGASFWIFRGEGD